MTTDLPEETVSLLVKLKEQGDKEELKDFVAELRAAGWPHRVIAAAIDVPHSTVQYWAKTANKLTSQPAAPTRPELLGTKTIRLRTHVPPQDRPVIAELAQQAKKIRSQTPAFSDLRRQSALLDLLIEENLLRHVSTTEIAQTMGVTPRAVIARLERRKAREQP